MRTFLAIMLWVVGLIFAADAIDEKKLVDMTYDFLPLTIGMCQTTYCSGSWIASTT